MSGGSLAIGIGVLFLIAGIVLAFISLYFVIVKRTLTTSMKWIYWGGAILGVVLGIIFMAVGGNMNMKAAALQNELLTTIPELQ